MGTLRSTNPASGELLREYPEMTWPEIEGRIEAAARRFATWRRESFAARAAPMREAAKILRRRSSELAELMAAEMGKPVGEGRGEADKCAWVCEYYADNAERFLAPEPIETSASHSYVSFQPLGVVLAIMPWNFPLWQVFRFAAPALMAGNTALLKHAPNVSGCALEIAGILAEAGFPDGAFAALLADVDAAHRVIAHPDVSAVTLTGSTRAGAAVAAAAGAALKKCVLELGGSDPYIVLEDCDLEAAVATCVKSRLINSGQSCIAAKRFIVVEQVRRRFEELVVERMRQAVVGDPMAEETQIGPLARPDLRENLHRQVTDSVAAGARLLCGGEVPDRPGAWYPPTVLAGVGPDMPAYDEELFGPVASIISASDEWDAIRIANDSRFGLGAAVFTGDAERGRRIAELDLEAGCCFVNDFVKSDPRLPFGGIKASGFGRELSSFGIREFVNVKTVSVA